jgi:hypothetical protein
MVSKKREKMRSIPVMAEIHESKAQTDGGSIVEKMAKMMGKTAQTAGKGAAGVCGEYFSSKTMPDTAALFVDRDGKQLLHIVTRAKKNAAGFIPPFPVPKQASAGGGGQGCGNCSRRRWRRCTGER